MKLSEGTHRNRKKNQPENEKLDMRSLRKGVIFLLVSQLVVLLLPSKSHAEDSIHSPLQVVGTYYQQPAGTGVEK